MSQFTAMENDLFGMLMEAAKRTAVASEQPEATEFDWDRPCCFEPHQVTRIEQLCEQAGQRLFRALKKLLRIEMNVAKVSVQYGKVIAAAPAGPSPYYMMLSDGASASCGYLAMPAAQAVGFVSKFLGGDSAAAPDREMSSLETELLLDIVVTVVNEFSAVLAAAGAKPVKQSGQLVRTRPDAFENTECCCFTFGSDAAADLPQLCLAIPCVVLEQVVSPANSQAGKPSAQECVKRLQAHLGTATVIASAWIGHAKLSMKDAMALEVGDVLALSTNIGQPGDLLVQGQPVAKGVLAVSDGRYALQITGR